MSTETIVNEETGETLGDVYNPLSGELVPTGEGQGVDELVPFNRMSFLARIPTRIVWDAKEGLWTGDMGDTETLTGKMLKASEIYICGPIGRATCFGVGASCPEHGKDCRVGIRVVMDTTEFGLAFVDAFGVSLIGPLAGAIKWAKSNDSDSFSFSGKAEYPSQYGRFFKPKLNRGK